jgi:proteic killer suppression protein
MAIRSFRHRGLKRLFEQGDRSRIRPKRVAKVRRILSRLNVAPTVADVDALASGSTRSKASYKSFWAVQVSANWRIIFRFKDGDAF